MSHDEALAAGAQSSMITFRFSTEVAADRQVVVSLPPETPLGNAEVTVTVAPVSAASSQRGALRQRFGAAHGGDAAAADNVKIDADLARAYDNGQK